MSVTLLVAFAAGQTLAEQVEITSETDVSPKGIAAIISQEMTSTLPPSLLEITVNYWGALEIVAQCPALRHDQAKFYAALDTAIKREHRYSRQDVDRHFRNLPRERLGELMGYFFYSIGARSDDGPSFLQRGSIADESTHAVGFIPVGVRGRACGARTTDFRRCAMRIRLDFAAFSTLRNQSFRRSR